MRGKMKDERQKKKQQFYNSRQRAAVCSLWKFSVCFFFSVLPPKVLSVLPTKFLSELPPKVLSVLPTKFLSKLPSKCKVINDRSTTTIILKIVADKML